MPGVFPVVLLGGSSGSAGVSTNPHLQCNVRWGAYSSSLGAENAEGTSLAPAKPPSRDTLADMLRRTRLH